MTYFIVLEYNQASGQPTPLDELYHTFADAEDAARRMKERAERFTRQETYAIAKVTIIDEDGPS